MASLNNKQFAIGIIAPYANAHMVVSEYDVTANRAKRYAHRLVVLQPYTYNTYRHARVDYG